MSRRLLAGAAIALLVAAPAHALFHIAHISELNAQAGGDAGVQYLEIEMETSLQRFVTDSVLGAWDCDGNYLGDQLLVPGDVADAGPGVRWIMATTTPLGGITPDFGTAAAGIPTDCGQVCWGAPGTQVPTPGSWDHTDPSMYVDCVAYGGYTGATHPGSGTPTPLPPGDGTFALARTSDGDDNAADFALACPSPENNAGDVGAFGPCADPTTTSTTTPGATTTTTTTTLPTAGTTDLLPAKKFLLRAKEGRPNKSRLVLVSRKDAALTLGRGAGSPDDPTQAGGRLIVASGSAAGAFLTAYPLTGGWSEKTRKGELAGYRFKGSGAIRSIKITGGKTLKIKAKGSELGHDLDDNPNPVVVVLELGQHAYCFELTGNTFFKANKRYLARQSTAPTTTTACDAIR